MAIDIGEVNTRVRFLMGGLTTAQLSDEILNQIIQEQIDSVGDDDSNFCQVTYNSILGALKYLIRASEAQAGSGSKDVSKRKEKNGNREIQVEYGTSSSIGESGWSSMYDHFLNHPQDVCEELVGDKPKSLVLIGGVSETEYNRVSNDADSRDAYKLSTNRKYGYRTQQSVRKRKNFSLK